MLQAWVVSPHEALYFAADATPCNLAVLRRHVRKMQRRLHARLHLSLGRGGSDVGVGVAALAAFARRLAADGVLVTAVATVESSGILAPPIDTGDEARLAAACSDDDGDRSSAPPTTVEARP